MMAENEGRAGLVDCTRWSEVVIDSGELEALEAITEIGGADGLWMIGR